MITFWYKYKSYILTFLFAMLFGAGVFCLYFFLKNRTLIDAINACSVSAVVLVFGGLLVVITRLGAFDTFAFGFKQLLTSMFNRNPNAYNSLADYRIQKYDERKNKKKTYLMLFLAGAVYALAIVILEIILRIIVR